MQSNTQAGPRAGSPGTLHRWRVRWFGERDAVDAQLADIARQGSGMSRLAHACAFAMIVLFSAGSLVTLSGDAVAAIVRGWQSGGAVDVPQAISVGVSGLLVLCLDTGMLLAASTLRVLRARRALWSERWVHVGIMCGVALVEASTYALMSVTYDKPHSAAAWCIILARSLSAPVLSVYLALAQPLPVGPRDILAQVELASGAAVLRDVVAIAHDAGATLERKVRLYDASAVAPEGERTRLARLIAVTAEPAGANIPPVLEGPSAGHPTALPEATQSAPAIAASDTPPIAPEAAQRDVQAQGEPPTRPPTGGGTPVAAPVRTRRAKAAPVIRLATPPESRRVAAQASAGGTYTRRVRTATVEAKARAAWRPDMSVGQFQRAAGISRSSAAKYRKVFAAEVADGKAAQ
ncbi:MAG: hypothetical protein IVW57_09165 [Ktedonobacterales bacterium]|nr:hypothetical protein [Ktedonobacterales bacterium]